MNLQHPQRKQDEPLLQVIDLTQCKLTSQTSDTPETNAILNDTVQQFFDSVSQYPLLSPDEEIALIENLEKSRLKYQEELFLYPLAARKAASLLQQVANKEIFPEKIIDDPNLRILGGRQKCVESLPEQVARILKHSKTVEALSSKRPETQSQKRAMTRARKLLSKSVRETPFFESLIDEIALETCIALHQLQLKGNQAPSTERDSLATLPKNAQKQSQKLFQLRTAYCEQKQALAQANMRLVISIAKRYNSPKHEFLDLIQYGNLGLMRACERFQSNKRHRFSTYAGWWIAQKISRGITEEGREIRIPTQRFSEFYALTKARDTLLKQGERPSAETLSKSSGLSIETVHDVNRIFKPVFSLDSTFAPRSAGSDSETRSAIKDKIRDTKGFDPRTKIRADELKEQVEKVLKYLPKEQQEVLKHRFGLDGYEQSSLQAIGDQFGKIRGNGKPVTKTRIRQIELQALQTLRDSKKWSEILKSFTEEL